MSRQAAKTTLFAAGNRPMSEKSAAGDFFPINKGRANAI
jgi:hypothetical protein